MTKEDGRVEEGEMNGEDRVGDWTFTNEFGSFILTNGGKDGFIKIKEFGLVREGELKNSCKIGIWK